MERIEISTPFIKLDQLLKLASWVNSGAEAKLVIQDGEVFVNGERCLMRGRKIRVGDRVAWDGRELEVIEA